MTGSIFSLGSAQPQENNKRSMEGLRDNICQPCLDDNLVHKSLSNHGEHVQTVLCHKKKAWSQVKKFFNLFICQVTELEKC